MTPYRYILLDPPWKFSTFSDKGMSRSAENHYPCLSLKEQIKLAPTITEVMDKDSVMMMWVTSCFLKQGLDLMEAYGYSYKTSGIWVKLSDAGKLQQGTGYHLRSAHELFLIGTRGKGGCPKRGTQKPSVMVSEWPNGETIIEPEDYFLARGEHSRKPNETFEYGDLYAGPHLQIYARRPHANWTVLGNDMDGRDIRDSLPELAQWFKDGISDEHAAAWLLGYEQKYAEVPK